MRRTFRLFLCVTLSVILCVSVFGGCRGRDDETNEIDTTKTQLYIGNCFGGLGDQWLIETANAFEEFYKDESFEPEKKGVQIVIDNELVGNIEGKALLTNIKSSRDDLFFTQAVNYYDFVNAGVLADITDVYEGSLAEFGENKTIQEKVEPYFSSFLKTKDEKYYALPFYDGFFGLYYDAGLFDKNNLYFKKGATAEGKDIFAEDFDLESLFVTNLTDEKSLGGDGVVSFDDGLPATYDDFFALTFYMYSMGITPMVWTGVYLEYLMRFAVSCWADAEGYDGMLANLTVDNYEAENLVDTVNDDGTVTYLPKTLINKENGYMLQKQYSKYQALEFFNRIVTDTKNYDPQSYGSALSHTGAQDVFLYSSALSTKKPIAMITEGSYWNNEATSTFTTMEVEYGDAYSKQNRKIGCMPIPRPTSAQIGKERTLVSLNDSYTFINKNSSGVRLTLAKKFLQFAHTDKSLSIFTKVTGMTKAFNYSIEKTTFDSMPFYAKSMYNLKKSANVIYPVTKNAYMMDDQGYFGIVNWGFPATLDNNRHFNPFSTFKQNTKYSVKDYFDGMYLFASNTWAGKIK